MLRRTCPALVVGLIAGLAAAGPREDEAKKYAADLKNKDAKVRLEAAKELGRLGGASRKLVAPYLSDLMSAMKDKDEKVRGEAAKTLGIADPEDKKAVVKMVADALKDEKSETARAGMETGLGELGAMATDDADARKMARDALIEARKKYADSKREQKVIQAALILINGPKKKKD